MLPRKLWYWFIWISILLTIDPSSCRTVSRNDVHSPHCPKLSFSFHWKGTLRNNRTNNFVACEEAAPGGNCSLQCEGNRIKGWLTCAKVWDIETKEYIVQWTGRVPECQDIKYYQSSGYLHTAALMRGEPKMFKLAQQSAKNCPALEVDSSQGVKGSCPLNPVGTTCFFTCRDNFYPTTGSGQFRLTCTDDPNEREGYWAGAIPNCKLKVCPTINAPANGQLSGNCVNASNGAQCFLTCTGNTRVVGTNVVRCITTAGTNVGQWDTSLGVCQSINCPNLDNSLVNGFTQGQCGNAIPGSTCTFNCRPGFTLIGNSQLQCSQQGTWNSPPPVCQVNSCPNIGSPVNGIASGACTNAAPASRCNFQCNSGYRLSGVSDLICQNDGKWTAPVPTCYPNLCPDQLAPINGGTTGSCSRAPIGGQCTFVCNVGYVLKGVPTLTCTGPDAVWNATRPTCERITCPTLANPDGGSSSGTCTNASPTNVCAFYCSNGFTLVGNNVTTCQVDGTWSSPVPQCQRVICKPDIAAPIGGALSGICTSATTGNECMFTCNNGYRLIGVNRITCQNNGIWTASPPRCDPIICPDLVAPANGEMSGTCVSASPNSACSFKCAQGFAVIGAPVLSCTDTGTWNAPSPTCNRVICQPLSPPPGGYSNGRCSNASPPDVCSFFCPTGSTLVGNPVSTCQSDGTWSSPSPTCQRNICPPLEPPTNGAASGTCTNAGFNDGCQFNCSAGYRLTGSSWISCLANGSWALPIATCERITCQSLSTPANAAASGVCLNAGVNAQCTFTCNAGYMPSTPMTLTCTNTGTWNGQLPTCQRVMCPGLLPPINGSYSGVCANAYPSSSCNYACDDGFRLIGAPVLKCEINGTWTPGQPPTCQRIVCPTLVGPTNGQIYGICTNAGQGQQCSFQCNPGYNPQSRIILTCQQTGTWNGAAPQCSRVICPDLVASTNGVLTGTCSKASPGDNCQFSCVPGYRVVGSFTATCQNDGTWANAISSCQRIECPNLSPPVNGAMTGSCVNAFPSQQCQFSCQRGYSLSGSPLSDCRQNGTWSTPIPTCSRIFCPNLVPPQNGNMTGLCATATPGQQCQFSCLPGYLLTGSLFSNCQDDGSWSSPTPTCNRILCPNRTPPQNGDMTGVCTAATPDQQCQFSCQPGFRLVGNALSNCQINGAWSSPVPTCEKIYCPNLAPPQNGNMTGMCTASTPGQRCQFTCSPGYILSGNPSTDCQANGIWTYPVPSCARIFCPNLAPPQNGNITGTCVSSTPGQQCQFTCLPGFRLTGSPTTDCKNDGTWTNQIPSCTRIYCPNLTPPQNGNMAGICTASTPTQQCQFTCNPGYLLTGKPTTNCQIDGTWSSAIPTCSKLLCPNLTPPTNGSMTGACTAATPNQQCQFTCAPGYVLTGSPTANCLIDGTWSSQVPTCATILCQNLTPPQNGQMTGMCTSAKPNQQCQFTCVPGYRLTGSPTANCLINGSWSTPVPTCSTILCQNLTPPQNGQMTGMCASATPTQQCQFTCNPGYLLTGSSPIRCQIDGTWSAQTPTCSTILCQNLTPPQNGQMTGKCTSATPTQQCQFTCNPGYLLTGSSTISCQNDGTWSAQTPTCAINLCPNLSPPQNGQMTGMCTSATPNQQCQFTCVPGYRLTGSPTANCLINGSWSTPVPTCSTILCQNLTPPQNGQMTGMCTSTTPTQQCRFTCNPGYLLTGSSPISCQNDGTWSAQIPTCARILCPNLTPPANGAMTGMCTSSAPNQQCQFSCNTGFRLTGDALTTCQDNGSWSKPTPTCSQIFCPNQIAPAAGTISGVCQNAKPKDQCSVTCNAGFMVTGSNPIVCQDTGTWNSPPPTCTAVLCRDLVTPIAGSYSGVCQKANPNAQCTYACNAGFRLSGLNPLTCQNNGTWSGPPPICSEILCPNLQNPSGGKSTGKCQQAVPKDTCTFSCDPGYMTSGNTNFVCQTDGTWSPSGSLPTCTFITCPPLTNPTNGAMTGVCTSATVNSNCRFSCNSGFQLFGNSLLQCYNTGAWSGPPPTCQRVTCPDLSPPQDGTSSGTCRSAISGSACTFGCAAGYIIQGQPVLTCTDQGSWNNPTPICLPVTCPDIQAPLNGNAVGKCLAAKINEVCSFTCLDGYRLEGSTSITCQSGSKWTSLAPRCIRITCPDLQTPQFGSVSGTCVQAAQGAQCNFVCTGGYALNGPASLTCQNNGQWNNSPPSCRMLRCPDLRAPVEGRAQGQCTQASPGSVCTFSCNPCYRLRGDSTLTCSGDGLWSGNAPICEVITCPNLTTPPVSAVFSGVCTSASPGNICKITCSATTQLRGANSLTCQANGTWSDVLPTCGALMCPTLVVPSGGKQNGVCNQAQPGSICTFTCNPGNTIMGPASLTCGPDGKWSGQPPTCTTVRCPDISPVANGLLGQMCRNAVSGNACSVTCNNGFRLVGAPTLTCRPDGTWDIPAPVCSALNCPVLPSPAGGSTSGVCSLARVNDKCTFTCNSGFQLQGTSTATCNPDGTWSSLPPKCLGVPCPDLVAPVGGKMSGQCVQATVGNTCSFSCNGELILIGTGSLVCQPGGTWNTNRPACNATPKCRDLVAPAGGSVSGQCTNAQPNAICTFTCTEGRLLKGFNQLTCRSDGTWSTDPPTCPGLQCPSLATPQNGIANGVCVGAAAGQSCLFSCTNGFVLTGQAQLTCNPTGSWSAPAPTCQRPGIKCPDISVQNAVVSGKCVNTEPGYVCQIACSTGFTISGPSKLICLATGAWDNTIPLCRAVTCPSIAAPENGEATGVCVNAQFNQRCDFKCKTGFALDGQNFLTCTPQGTWNDNPPLCPPVSCPDLSSPEFGSSSGICASVNIGEKCDFTCEPGFKLSGATTLTCKPTGDWDSNPPSCVRVICPRKLAITNGRITGICQDATVEQICSFECVQGYKIQGTKDLTCTNDGKWNNESPTCIQTRCPPLATPNNGRQTGSCAQARVAEECTFSCNIDYNLNGAPRVTCKDDGTWSAAAPTCDQQVRCPNLQDPPGGGGRGTCFRADPGKTCTFTCDSGFVLVGEGILTCQATGQWSKPPPKCNQITCPGLSAPENGRTSGTCNSRAIYGDECRFTCERGYQLTGRSTTRCRLDGTWTENPPTCSPVSCGPITNPQNGVGNEGCTIGLYNARCTITCNTGYRLIGTSTIVCTPNAHWSAETATCEIQTCRSLTAPANGRMTGRCSPGNAFLDCNFECNIGYRLQGTAQIKCEATGQWNGREPTCVQIQCPALAPVLNALASGQCSPGLPGAACRYICRRGFKLIGPPVIDCTLAGTWATQPPTCEATKCPDLTAPASGSITGACKAATLDGKCTFKCSAGFGLVGRSVLTCQADEQWDDITPVCLLNECDELGPPDDGSIDGDCSPGVPGKTCTFACSPNFKLIGRPVLTCRNNGTWSSQPPRCDEIKCPRLNAPTNGSTDGICEPNGLAPETCTFFCNPGNRLVGSATLTCQDTGRWDNKTPRCQPIICPTVGPPLGAAITGQCTRAVPGQQCLFTCINLNTRLVGERMISCNDDGTWSAAPPKCEAITCREIPPPPNGRANGRCIAATVNDICTFSCLPGYGLTGQPSVTCTRDGVWSGPAPDCRQGTCPALATPTNGVAEGSCAPGLQGQTCTFKCNQGFRPPSTAFTCQAGGIWNPVPPNPIVCTADNKPEPPNPNPNPICTRLLRPPNGRIDRCDLFSGGKCLFVCNEGYVIYGESVRTCQSNRRWDGLAPTCIKRTVVIPNGSYQRRN